MLLGEGFVRTRYTDFPLARNDAMLGAKETYGTFATNVFAAERLAKLSLTCFNTPGPRLSDDDVSMLRRGKYLEDEEKEEYKTPDKLLTTRGIVAINMVGVQVFNRDLEFYLREPFVDVDILDQIHTLSDFDGTILT